ncbi:MAG: putative salt-induced outer membrane protein YdiY [Chlamydiales bacterium]|jgi:putative salt-induced outer membrane protein YdiY
MMIAPFCLLHLLPLVTTPEAPAAQTQDSTPVVAGEDVEAHAWAGSVAIGGSITDGNTNITRGSVTADGVRQREKDRVTLGLSWNYAEEEELLTQRRTFARGQYDYFLSEKSYLLGDLSVQSDAEADLDLRTSVGTGYGRQLMDDDTWKLGVEAGVAYVDEDLGGVPGNDFLAARLAYDVTWQATKAVACAQHMKLYPSLEDAEDVFGQLDTRVKVSLTESMFAQAQWVFDWNNTPATGRDRADNLFLVSIGWSF